MPASEAQRTPPSPYAGRDKPLNWGPGPKDPGAGCWKAVDKDVARETRGRND